MGKNILCIIVLLILFQSSLLSQWNNDPAINTPVCTAENSYPSYLAMISDGDGGTIIAWMDYRNDNNFQIYAQHLDKNGYNIWSANGIRISPSGDAQWQPTMVPDNAGGAIFIWGIGASSLDLFAQHIDKAGNILWQPNGVPVCTAPGYSQYAKAVSDNKGGAYICWTDTRGGLPKIYAQHLNANGTMTWQTNGVATNNSISSQSFASLIQHKNGGVYISWQDERNTGIDVYTQRLDEAGNLLWAPEGLPIRVAVNGSGTIKMINDASDGTILFWADARNSPEGTDIYAQKINADGKIQWTKDGLRMADPQGELNGYDVIASEDGGMYLAFSSHLLDDFSDCKIYSKRIDLNGNDLWGTYGVIIKELLSAVYHIDILPAPDGGFFIGWSDNRNGTGEEGYDIFAQKLDANGKIQWQQEGLPVCTAPNFQGNTGFSILMAENTCGPIIAWQDGRVSKADAVFATRIINLAPPAITISTSSSQICAGTPVTFDAVAKNGGLNPKFLWLKNGQPTGQNSGSYIDSQLKNKDSIYCILTITDSCVSGLSASSDTIIIKLDEPLNPTIIVSPNVAAVCAGTAVTFKAAITNAGPSPAYQWKVNGTNSGTNSDTYISSTISRNDLITCTLTNSNTCTNIPFVESAPVQITVSPIVQPSVTIDASQTTICKGTNVMFTAKAVNAGNNPSFEWKVNDVKTGDLTNSFSSMLLNDGDRITCSVMPDNTVKCLSVSIIFSDTIMMTVSNASVPVITITVIKMPVCQGEVAAFTASGSNNIPALSYQWKLNGGDAGGNGNNYINDKPANNDEVFCVATTTGNNCGTASANSNMIKILVSETPILLLQPKDTLINPGASIQLHAAVNGSIAAYQWQPAAYLINPNTLSPFTVPLLSNTQFTISVTNADGCSTTGTAVIKISDKLPIALPTAFTPNGDGNNDYFRVPPRIIITLEELSIYDRWGNMVFSTSDLNKGWDGTTHGKKVPAGTYVYFLNGKNNTGAIHLKGSVVLIR